MSNDQLKLFKELKNASKDCWSGKIAAYEMTEKHAPLCVQIVKNLDSTPKLFNKLIEKRIQETDGRGVLEDDFWKDPDMIIALYEYIEREYDLIDELKDAETGENNEPTQGTLTV